MLEQESSSVSPSELSARTPFVNRHEFPGDFSTERQKQQSRSLGFRISEGGPKALTCATIPTGVLPFLPEEVPRGNV